MASPGKTPLVLSTSEAAKAKAAIIHGGFGTTATPANNIGGDPVRKYRRSSSNSTAASQGPPGALFAGLVNHKRGSTDAEAMARRQSFHDQKPTTGFLGTWWNKYTTGGK